MNRTSIEWTHRPETGGDAGGFTWNPIRARFKDDAGNVLTGTACTHASPGCLNCYAEAINKRFGTGLPYSVPALNRIEFFISEKILEEPLHKKKPATIFGFDMNDLFLESHPDSLIDRVFAIATVAHWHTFQFLTKRADRMHAYLTDRDTPYRIQQAIDGIEVNQEMSGVQEEFRAVPGYEGHYEISNFGNVRSKTLRPLSPVDDHKGYLRVALSKSGIVKQFFVHRLVLAAFVGESTDECRHRNGISADNRLANLRYCEHIENVADRTRHGTSGAWMKSEAPLTDAEVSEIRARRAKGEKLKDIEASTGVDRRKISQIAHGKTYKVAALGWPLPNVWLGVSVEDKKRAYERIPQLQMTPAAVRFLSIEPQLEEVPTGFDTPELGWVSWLRPLEGVDPVIPRIDWVICGGESGPGARPFNLAWAESLLEQCRAAGVPFFMKQCGSVPMWSEEHWNSRPTIRILKAANRNRVPAGYVPLLMNDRKGGDIAEWPSSLQVREFPSQKAEVVHA